MKNKLAILVILAVGLTGCGGESDWSQLNLPKDCVVKTIVSSLGYVTGVLCEDGRIFIEN